MDKYYIRKTGNLIYCNKHYHATLVHCHAASVHCNKLSCTNCATTLAHHTSLLVCDLSMQRCVLSDVFIWRCVDHTGTAWNASHTAFVMGHGYAGTIKSI